MHRQGLSRQTVLDTIFVTALDLLIIIKLLTQQPDCTRLLILGSCLSVYSFLGRFVSLDNMLTKLILELKWLILQTTNFDVFAAYRISLLIRFSHWILFIIFVILLDVYVLPYWLFFILIRCHLGLDFALVLKLGLHWACSCICWYLVLLSRFGLVVNEIGRYAFFGIWSVCNKGSANTVD